MRIREDDLEGQEDWVDVKDVVCAHTLAPSITPHLAFLQNERPLLRAPQQSANVLDRDVGYDRKSDGQRTTPAPHKICCIYPKKSSIATKLESGDHYIVENK